MKKVYLVVSICSLFGLIQANVYFWQADRDGERSCCLFLNGSDICNPYQPCTRNANYDLNGILEYISRILVTDKGSAFAYHKVLNQAQNFIRHALMSGMNMYYRYDEPARLVKFYHEISETTKSNEKAAKSNAVATAATENRRMKMPCLRI